jgi:trimeric autotransporter adhesin
MILFIIILICELISKANGKEISNSTANNHTFKRNDKFKHSKNESNTSTIGSPNSISKKKVTQQFQVGHKLQQAIKEHQDLSNPSTSTTSASNDIQATNFQTQPFNFNSKEDVLKQQSEFDRRLVDLKQQLDKLRQLTTLTKNESDNEEEKIKKILSDWKNDESITNENNDNNLISFVTRLINERKRISIEAEENWNNTRLWLDKQKQETCQQYLNENSQSILEFSEKRRELKEALIAKQDELKRQIEIDRNTLDINMDTSDPRPTTTRKLRRRVNNNNSNSTSELTVSTRVSTNNTTATTTSTNTVGLKFMTSTLASIFDLNYSSPGQLDPSMNGTSADIFQDITSTGITTSSSSTSASSINGILPRPISTCLSTINTTKVSISNSIPSSASSSSSSSSSSFINQSNGNKRMNSTNSSSPLSKSKKSNNNDKIISSPAVSSSANSLKILNDCKLLIFSN